MCLITIVCYQKNISLFLPFSSVLAADMLLPVSPTRHRCSPLHVVLSSGIVLKGEGTISLRLAGGFDASVRHTVKR
uniref:Putative secreted protein n=1 Tax=Anopheles darlingi TaxID=43151 RepID=A0A2M4DFP0_ANODA